MEFRISLLYFSVMVLVIKMEVPVSKKQAGERNQLDFVM